MGKIIGKDKIVKICPFCNKAIDLEKDNYVHVVDYFKGEFYKDAYYHTDCYIDRINGSPTLRTKMLSAMAVDLYKKANKMMKEQGGRNESSV